LTLSFSKRQRTEVTDYFKGYVRDWFWNAEVRRNPAAFGYNRPRVIKGSTKAFQVARLSFAKFQITEVKQA
jgi:hypothetical protein